MAPSVRELSGIRVPKLAKAVSVMQGALTNPVSTAEIAAQAGLSTRQPERPTLNLSHEHPAPPQKDGAAAMAQEGPRPWSA